MVLSKKIKRILLIILIILVISVATYLIFRFVGSSPQSALDISREVQATESSGGTPAIPI